jgi:hypothetical protein
MADIAGMETVAFDVLDGDYQDGGKNFVSLPPEGKYIGQAPVITDESFGLTRENYLKLTIDPITIVGDSNGGGTGKDYKVRFTRLSAKKYSNRNGSQVMDYLRACGFDVKPNSPDELKQYLKMTSGKTFQFALQWEGYDKNDPERDLRGADKFGGNTWVASEIDPEQKVYANGKVRFFISAVGK